MGYKVGDKVKIKTWKQMEKEFELSKYGWIRRIESCIIFLQSMENDIEKTNRVLTIKKIDGKTSQKNVKIWHSKELLWGFSTDIIECLASDYKEPIPITSRFEILDL